MRTQIMLGAVTVMAVSLLAADAKEDVKAAAKKLAGATGYSWKATTEMGGGAGGGGGAGAGAARMRPGPTEGKAIKDGTICLSMTRGDTTTEAYVLGEKGAIKTQDGWQSLAEVSESAGGGQGGQGGRGSFMARMLRNYKAPAVEASEIADKTQGLKKEGDAFVGELTAEGVKSLMMMGRRPGGQGPEVAEPKGAVKFWLKDGVLARYEYKVSGKMTFNNNEREINRTTTVEIKDVGTTKLDVPAEAKKKLS